jgi:hypothetical protein
MNDINIRTFNKGQIVTLLDQANCARHEMFAADVIHLIGWSDTLLELLIEARQYIDAGHLRNAIDQVKGAKL